MRGGLTILARCLAIRPRIPLGEAPAHFLTDALPVLRCHLRHGTGAEPLEEHRLQPLRFPALPIFAHQLVELPAHTAIGAPPNHRLHILLEWAGQGNAHRLHGRNVSFGRPYSLLSQSLVTGGSRRRSACCSTAALIRPAKSGWARFGR